MTTRAAVLAVIVCALVLALAYPIRAYFAQRSEIRRLEQRRATAQQSLAALERERAQWDDPAFVEAQARQRLRYVKPGEKSLIVIGTPPAPSPVAAGAAAAAPASDAPWYGRLWSTVVGAGATASAPASSPAASPAPAAPTPRR